MQTFDAGGGGGPGGGGGGSFIHYDALDISKEVGHEGHGSAELVYVAPSARSLRTQVDIRVRYSNQKMKGMAAFRSSGFAGSGIAALLQGRHLLAGAVAATPLVVVALSPCSNDALRWRLNLQQTCQQTLVSLLQSNKLHVLRIFACLAVRPIPRGSDFMCLHICCFLHAVPSG
jgi:hypothetical protein